MNILLRPWVRFADFQGRSRRAEYLLFILVSWVLLAGSVAAGISLAGIPLTGPAVDSAFAPGSEPNPAVMALPALCMLLLLMPNLAVTVRRLHDQDKSGFFFLLTLIPLIGIIFALIIAFGPGTEGENRFGDDPRFEGETRYA